MMKKILKVDSIRITPIEDGKFAVDAGGVVSTAGWTNPHIVGAGIIDNQGTLAYDFEAQPPSGQALQVITPVHARAEFGGPGTSLQGLKRVKVSSQQGDVFAAFPPHC